MTTSDGQESDSHKMNTGQQSGNKEYPVWLRGIKLWLHLDEMTFFQRRLIKERQPINTKRLPIDTEGNKQMDNLVCHAVITDIGVSIISEDGHRIRHLPLRNDIGNIADAWVVGQQMGISHFWVLPGSHFDRDGRAVFEVSEEYNVFVTYEDDKNKEAPMFARCWKVNAPGTHKICIGYAFRGRFGWTVKKPVDILATIEYIRRLTGMNVEWSPAYMGMEVLTGMFSSSNTLKNRVKNPDTDLYSIPAFRETAGRDLSWKYDFSGNTEMLTSLTGMYLHSIDRNGNYLAAMRTVDLGVGEASHIEEPFKIPAWAGIYRVVCDKRMSRFSGVGLPTIIANRQEWVTRDIVAYMMEMGYGVEIKEAWIFTKSYPLLANFAHKIWDHRESFKNCTEYPYEQARINAYQTMKGIATGVGGRFNAQDARTFRHPNWWWDIVGYSRKTILSFLRMMQDAGLFPVVAYADNLVFLSAEPDIFKALAHALVKRDQLGGFKPQYTVQITDDVIGKLINSSPSAIIGHLKKVGHYHA